MGARLRALRQQAGLSQRELADGLVHKSMISQIESGRTHPSHELLRHLALRLGADPDHLLPVLQDDQERLARYKRAQAFFTLHHYAQALPLLEDCLPVSNPAWNPYDLHLQIATCHHWLEQYLAALLHLDAALTIAIAEDRREDVLHLHIRIGETALEAQLWTVAHHRLEFAYRETVQHPERLSPPERLPQLCIALARALAGLDRQEQAVQVWLEASQRATALDVSQSVQLRLEAEIAAGLGKTYAQLGKFREAELQLERAQSLYEKGWLKSQAVRMRLQRAVLLAESGRLHEALQWLEECRDLAERERHPVLQAEVLHGQAEAWMQAGRLFRARECAERAVHLLTEARREGELVTAYQLLSAIEKRLGHYRRASECLTRSQELFTKRMGWMKKSLRILP
nr:helix-turn-helix transcriptional regulator [Tumebacillus amylolyticus]